ncbi:MAG: yphA [Lacunisphaera sp.]|nr:yphA [Lacunisphaera sp.]
MQLRPLLARFDAAASLLQSPLLFIVRLHWGYAFLQTGWGKLMNLDRTAGFFESLHIPMPRLNAIMAGSTESIGGVLLMLGLFARPAAVPLAFTMLVAYATADREALLGIFSTPDKFLAADPFLFLLAAVLVLAFGPGRFSLDALLFRKSAT